MTGNHRTRKFSYFVPNIDGGDLLENFLISAIFSTIGVRFYLYLFGFPEFGGERFHIAHVLWGGLLMTIAIFLLAGFLNKWVKELASIIGGIGFGFFVDELGKYITHDNNYFYQPTIALIYLIFIFIFLISRASRKYIQLTRKEYSINALEVLKEFVLYDYDVSEKNKALDLIERGHHDGLMRHVMDTLRQTHGTENGNMHLEIRLKHYFQKLYIRIAQNSRYTKALVSFFILYTLLNTYRALASLQNVHAYSYIEIGQLISSVFSGALVIIGLYYIRYKQRVAGYEFLKYSVLVNIFITQFFVFYQERLSSVMILFVNILIYIVLRYLIAQESLYHPKLSKSRLAKMKNFFVNLMRGK
ncbi:hypothetical protein A3I56_04870 [Candidatus Roizmanbacteria bacterium RIFCSPLOWO2_02_FULL_43_10]|uniref:Uncharacterized protein n=3 Tax=Candidatus Roizmaniibacteriota TaxID=1752723 RepID=A0A1F7K192_9BACT|nr:MAG: hypothetical protein A3D08_03380 [Candidatus Roizmanbacteria bacterium RIFCSPHIGHO2_02_FULL_43_11]OGK38863.1 MAG: hypothetical protein A3F32_02675 [Candidatus Roizmanbacteria bacterium RIFCSPHIGHO2_12_FULL_42_10]OGK61626.1 MAG: hypothetical protein A3I56_04870 [Candidatus Roizmanbacteria bacterium RIFCSPLOWO2_02_FULL_43_10]